MFHIGTNLNAADFFTKPLTGEKFSRFRDFLMGGYIRRDGTLQTWVPSPYFRRLPSIPRWTEHGCQATLIPSVFQSYVSRDDVLLRITTWGSAESRTD